MFQVPLCPTGTSNLPGQTKHQQRWQPFRNTTTSLPLACSLLSLMVSQGSFTGSRCCTDIASAWNIGANDVANSFATSVSSRSLTMLQAMCIATVCEFGGAVLAGARVSGTIKNGIIPAEAFTQTPSILMLGMMCALVGSSLWLTLATKVDTHVGFDVL